MADVWANSMACHPRATCHTAGCCHLANSMSIPELHVTLQGAATRRILWHVMSSQSHVSHCRVLPLGEFTVTIPEPHATLQGAVTWWNVMIVPHSLSSFLAYSKSFFAIFYFFAFWCSLYFDEWWLSYRLQYTCLNNKCCSKCRVCCTVPVEELQLVMLKCREELIAEKVGRERDCELLSSELELLRSQTSSDEKSRQQTHTQIARLQEQLGKPSCSLLVF